MASTTKKLDTTFKITYILLINILSLFLLLFKLFILLLDFFYIKVVILDWMVLYFNALLLGYGNIYYFFISYSARERLHYRYN